MTERLSTPVAQTLCAGITEEWAMLRSELTEAIEGRAWEALGYDRMADWLVDTLGDMTWPLPYVTREAPRSASVSAPGRRFDERRLSPRSTWP